MGLVGFVVGLPLAPVRGVIALSRLIQERVEHEQRNPSSIRRSLEEAEQARAAGEISPEDEAEIQRHVVGRVVQPNPAENREE